LNEIKDKICQLEKVVSVHHMHVWSLEGENHVFSVHAKLAQAVSIYELVDIKTQIKTILKSYPFSHYTVEIELDGEECLMENSDHDH
jgi:cobalt-zinc-cadmium efflux system protein